MAKSELKKKSLLLADGNYLMRQGLISILREQPDYTILGETDSFDEVIPFITRNKPEGILIGLNLQSGSGIALIREIRSRFPKMKIIVIDTKEDVSEIIAILKLGAQGYILKQCDRNEILDALRTVFSGKTFFCHNVMTLNKTIESEKPVLVSERELQVLSLISEGMTNKEIAERIFISEHTVASHRKNLMRKFEAGNNVDLVIKAIKERIIIP
jgi:DNA-binding NarL/FixJ family response regulator